MSIIFLQAEEPNARLIRGDGFRCYTLQHFPSDVFFLIGLAQIIPASTASVEKIFSSMKSLCTSSRTRMTQASLDALMRICSYHQKNKSLTDSNLNSIIEQFKNMKTRDLTL